MNAPKHLFIVKNSTSFIVKNLKSFKIRSFRRTDINRIVEIEKECFPNPWAKIFFEVAYSSYPRGFLVAEMNGKVVGYAVATIEGMVGSAQLLNLAVDKRYRGRGIGSLLLREVIKRVREDGASKIFLQVRVSNFKAITLYLNFNFQIERILPKYYHDGEDAYLMSKKLAS